MNSIRHIHFIAICGTAMASLAAMLKSQGYEISGSDRDVYPPMSTFLEEQGITIYHGFDAANLEPTPDLVIIGNAVSRGNPELEAVLNQKLKYTSLPEALKEFFIRGKYSIVVTGTHGKTTTSSLLAWILEYAGQDPGFLIGGIPENFGRGYKIGKGKHFVVEGDEYDTAFYDKRAKFFHYLPDLVIINNIEFDHADIYDSLDQIKLAFRRLINIIPANGFLIASFEDPNVQEILPAAFCPVETFGLSQDAHWRAEEITFNAQETSFSVFHNGQFFARLTVTLSGYHNVKNALAAIAAAHHLNIPLSQIREGLKTFANVKKRLEVRAVVNDITIFDDFAHHPTEVRATLEGLRTQYGARKIWAVFEPRTATSKRKIFQEKYAEAFATADVTIIASLHRPDKVPAEERLSAEALAQHIKNHYKQAYYIPSVEEIVTFLVRHLKSGDLVLIMSNGEFGGIHNKLIQALKTFSD